MKVSIKKISEHPTYSETAAQWFSSKWNLPYCSYVNSMKECMDSKTTIPQWYFVLNTKGDIIAGAGVIEHDFHDRPDLYPNLCALYVMEQYRKQGIARTILDYIRKDCHCMGFEKIYLVSDHTSFYETCGWDFMCFVHDENGREERLYVAST